MRTRVGPRLHALSSLLTGLTASRPTYLRLQWRLDVRRRHFSSDKSPHALSRVPAPVSMSEPEMVRRLMRSQRVWWWMGGFVLSGVGLVAFGPELKLGMSKHTAEVASRSLQDETLRDNSRELASQIVQTVLNDPKVLAQASQFLRRLVVMESTREALRTLVIHTLNDPKTRTQVVDLTKHTVAALVEDPKTLRQVVDLLRSTIVDPQAKEALFLLLAQVMRDEKTRANLAQMLTQTFMQEIVKETVSKTLGDSVHEVLSRGDVQNHAKEFVSGVVQDQTVQAQSGDAIWGTVLYALTPTWLSWMWAHPEEMATEEGVSALAEVSKVMVAAAVVESELEKTKHEELMEAEKQEDETTATKSWTSLFKRLRPSFGRKETVVNTTHDLTSLDSAVKEEEAPTASSQAELEPVPRTAALSD